MTDIMANKHQVKLKSDSGTVIYTTRNKKSVEEKLKLKKFDKKVRKHVEFKEVKK